MDRKRMLNGFKAAAEVGPYDEFPVLVGGIDPQVYLSRNDRPQPFYLICEKDSLLAQMAGTGRLLMKYSPVLWEPMQPGDFVYIPAGTPHRYVPTTESLQTRYKADPAGLEGVAWFCDGCGTEIAREEWDTRGALASGGLLASMPGVQRQPGATHLPRLRPGPSRARPERRAVATDCSPTSRC